MAIAKIIQKANNFQWSHSLSLVQQKSDGGIRKAQRRGPNLYNVTVAVNTMHDNSDSYHDIQGELRTMGYGVNTISTQMPSSEVYNRGTWAGSPKVKGASQSGTSVILDGFTSSVADVVRDGDWLTFPSDTKVYQVVGNASSNSSGEVTITLNTPLIKSPGDNAVLVLGSSIHFQFALVNPDSVDPTKTPAGTHSWAQFGSFEFEEVLS